MKIFCNAGHGVRDVGAVSPNGNLERDINRKISRILVNRLIDAGFNVEFFQEQDSINEIISQENQSKPDIFLSIHCNSFTNPNVNGTETYYYEGSSRGELLAKAINDSIVSKLALTERGAKPERKYIVLSKTKALAALIECAFLSNENDENLLMNRADKFAEAICEGIGKFLDAERL